ncbi:hypothetical protein L6452_32827 [Arctium lappa]|uniref:Uncharacterized protein n=1 Tax=Arctium lappa TaxID=4217 RepID=A0ACB8Z6B0_ARCLA|nr:hypothetical protein L6452_32827 [Arctium lappa]
MSVEEVLAYEASVLDDLFEDRDTDALNAMFSESTPEELHLSLIHVQLPEPSVVPTVPSFSEFEFPDPNVLQPDDVDQNVNLNADVTAEEELPYQKKPGSLEHQAEFVREPLLIDQAQLLGFQDKSLEYQKGYIRMLQIMGRTCKDVRRKSEILEVIRLQAKHEESENQRLAENDHMPRLERIWTENVIDAIKDRIRFRQAIRRDGEADVCGLCFDLGIDLISSREIAFLGFRGGIGVLGCGDPECDQGSSAQKHLGVPHPGVTGDREQTRDHPTREPRGSEPGPNPGEADPSVEWLISGRGPIGPFL